MAGRHRGFRVEEVLHEVMMTFWKSGYQGAGIADLERATGLGRQSLYATFGDKRQLFLAAVEQYFAVVVRPGMIDVLDRADAAVDGLEDLFNEWEKLAEANGYHGCLIGNAVAELGEGDPEMHRFLRQKLGVMEDAFRRAIERAQAQGDVAPDVQPESTSRALLAIYQGLAIIARVDPNPKTIASIVSGARTLLKR